MRRSGFSSSSPSREQGVIFDEAHVLDVDFDGSTRRVRGYDIRDYLGLDITLMCPELPQRFPVATSSDITRRRSGGARPDPDDRRDQARRRPRRSCPAIRDMKRSVGRGGVLLLAPSSSSAGTVLLCRALGAR